MKIVIIDGQGGKMGAALVKKIKEELPSVSLYAIGTNSIATSAMLRCGADFGATGENPVIRNARDADIVLGPIGIVVADAILGEVTPAMAAAVGSTGAKKILVPMNNCSTFVCGVQDKPLSAYIADAVEMLKAALAQ